MGMVRTTGERKRHPFLVLPLPGSFRPVKVRERKSLGIAPAPLLVSRERGH
jgi:hypothetical protein